MNALKLSTVRRFGFGIIAAAALLVAAAPATAQVGTAVLPITVQTEPASAYIAFGPSSNQWHTAETLGGVTLFASTAPNGAILARLVLPPPYPTDELLTPPGWGFHGVPPGTYYVALVYGVVASPNLPANAWTRLDVPGACSGPPGIGLLTRDLGGVPPDTVRVITASFGGCASSYLVEAGTTPGAANVASFELAAGVLMANSVPAGNYYLRVRGRNQFGVGPYSAVLPVAVPGCTTSPTDEIDNLTTTVVGHTVTLTWTPPDTPPDRPVTFYELALLNGVPAGTPPPRVLIPAAVSSFSATVPSGTYRVRLHAGNACNWDMSTDAVVVTVP